MFDDQLALVTDATQISYAKIAESLSKAIELVDELATSDTETFSGVLGAVIATQLLLLKKLDQLEGKFKNV